MINKFKNFYKFDSKWIMRNLHACIAMTIILLNSTLFLPINLLNQLNFYLLFSRYNDCKFDNFAFYSYSSNLKESDFFLFISKKWETGTWLHRI